MRLAHLKKLAEERSPLHRFAQFHGVTSFPALKTAAPVPILSPIARTPRLSIVVLPFTNLSDDRGQQYFADGITDDLTSDLSRIAGMFVISRNTAFTYRNRAADTKLIGRELGVRYLIEGTVQRWGNRVRVRAQLIDAETDAHLWAERFDGETGDLFGLQDEITSRIAAALNLEVVGAEAARPNQHPDAIDCILRGRAAFYRPATRENYADAIGYFERALALDEGSIEAQSWLANALAARVLDNLTGSAAGEIARANGVIAKALTASPRSPLAHFAKGQVLRAQHRCAEAIPEYERALAFNRNDVGAIFMLGHCKLMVGAIDEVIPLQKQAIRLSPRDPYIGKWYWQIGAVHLLQSRTDEAFHWLEQACRSNPTLPLPRAWLTSAFALKGETERAEVELIETRRLSGDDRYSSIARLMAVADLGVPAIRALYEATYLTGLSKAGMPEK